MEKKRTRVLFHLVMSLMVCMCVMLSGTRIKASSLEDNIGGSSGATTMFGGDVDPDDQALGDWISKQRGMTGQNLETASNTLSPLVNILGNVVGGIIVLVFAGVFCMTALDLLYIAVPPIRGVLYKGGPAGGMAASPGMGMGMGMGGYGMRRGMMGGGMGMMGNQGMAEEQRPKQWISDEALQCAAMLNSGGAAASPMGGMGMGGMAMQNAAASGQAMSMKSVIGMYFKKRMFFMIMLAICAIVLTSSVLLGTGVNLALWINKIFSSINGNIPK